MSALSAVPDYLLQASRRRMLTRKLPQRRPGQTIGSLRRRNSAALCRYRVVERSDSKAYPQGKKENLGEVNYAQLKSGKIAIQGKEVPTGNLSSYSKAMEIANTLKGWIKKGDFLLTEPVAYLPGPETGYAFKPLRERPIKE